MIDENGVTKHMYLLTTAHSLYGSDLKDRMNMRPTVIWGENAEKAVIEVLSTHNVSRETVYGVMVCGVKVGDLKFYNKDEVDDLWLRHTS